MDFIVHPEFVACSPLTENHYWKELLRRLSYGRPLPGFSFDGQGRIVWFRGKRRVSYLFRGKAPPVLLKDIQRIFAFANKDFCRKELQKSLREEEKERAAALAMTQVARWGRIKRRCLQIILLEDFVYQNAERFAFPRGRAHRLYQDLQIVIALYPTAEYLAMAPGREGTPLRGAIESVRGLRFYKGGYSLSFPGCETPTTGGDPVRGATRSECLAPRKGSPVRGTPVHKETAKLRDERERYHKKHSDFLARYGAISSICSAGTRS